MESINKKECTLADGIDADFCIINIGDSMINARIFDGDLIYIRQQDSVENGDIAIYSLNGNVGIGRFWEGDDYISFTPENPMYQSFRLFGEEMKQITIIGKAVAFTSNIQ